MSNFQTLSSLIWNVADDVLRGLFKPHEYREPVEKLHKNNRLFLLVEKFSSVDLHPDVVDNHTMGQIYEELLRKFSEMSNETSGEEYKSDLLISGENPDHIRLGSSLGEDGFTGEKFDYMITNPPFGVSWKSEEEFVTAEAQNPNGRFFAGTPRTSDGSLLFLQHMISKMEEKGSRIGIVFNGSPLFTGDAGSMYFHESTKSSIITCGCQSS